jgi:hypothetical protein
MLHGQSAVLANGASHVSTVAKGEIGFEAYEAGAVSERRLGQVSDLGLLGGQVREEPVGVRLPVAIQDGVRMKPR